MKCFLLLLLLPIVVLSSGEAVAAKLGRVAIDNAAIIDKPGPGAKIIGRLPKGTVIAAADQPNAGYYRMKSKTGLTGYIAARAVSFGAAPSTSAAAEGTPASPRRKRREETAASNHRSGGFMVRAFGDLDMFNSTTAVAAVTELTGLSNGIGLGVELAYALSPSLTGMIRVESITRAIRATIATGTDTDTSYSISVASLPIMVGAAFNLMEEESLAIDFGILAGMGLGTKLTAEATANSGGAFPTPTNVNTFSKSAITFMGKFDLFLKLGSSLSLFAEAGYRMLKAANATRTTAGTGAGLFRATNGAGALLAVSPNLSGPVIGLGVQLRF